MDLVFLGPTLQGIFVTEREQVVTGIIQGLCKAFEPSY